MIRSIFITLILISGFVVAEAEGSGPMLFSRLTVNQTHIAFAYAGDIWIVERSGGEARKLTRDPGEENFPVFSPDGSQIAFSRQVGGNWDVYVMPVNGGDARRVTFDPRSELSRGWPSDGPSMLFASS